MMMMMMMIGVCGYTYISWNVISINVCKYMLYIYIHPVHTCTKRYIYIPLNTVTHTCVYTHIYIYIQRNQSQKWSQVLQAFSWVPSLWHSLPEGSFAQADPENEKLFLESHHFCFYLVIFLQTKTAGNDVNTHIDTCSIDFNSIFNIVRFELLQLFFWSAYTLYRILWLYFVSFCWNLSKGSFSRQGHLQSDLLISKIAPQNPFHWILDLGTQTKSRIFHHPFASWFFLPTKFARCVPFIGVKALITCHRTHSRLHKRWRSNDS